MLDEKWDIYIFPPHNILADYKGEKEYFYVREPGRHLLHQMIQSTSSVKVHIVNHVPPGRMQKENLASFSDGSRKDSKHDLITRKH